MSTAAAMGPTRAGNGAAPTLSGNGADPAHPHDGAHRLARSRDDIARWLDDAGEHGSAKAPTVPELAARALLASAARRHPWALVGGAAAAGAALAAARPWRWWLRPAMLAAVAAPVVSDLAARWLQQAMRPARRRADADPPSPA